MPQKQLIYKIEAGDEGRVDRIVARLTDFSRSRVRGLMLHGGVSINQEVTADAGALLVSGDELKIDYDEARKYRDAGPLSAPVRSDGRSKVGGSQRFQLIHQDETLVIVNKEAGLLTVPTEKRESQNLVDLLSRMVNPNRRTKLSLIHRLDRDTSGLLAFGQDQRAADSLIEQFAARKPKRIYAAIVKGTLKDKSGTIESYLQTDKALNQKSNTKGQGELAITHYEVIETLKNATLIQVQLETGRRNQIRAHFAELGHPVLGDQRYHKEKAQHPAWPHKRLALHARSLGFQHPATGETMHFEIELPKEFLQFVSSQKPKTTSSQTTQALD